MTTVHIAPPLPHLRFVEEGAFVAGLGLPGARRGCASKDVVARAAGVHHPELGPPSEPNMEVLC